MPDSEPLIRTQVALPRRVKPQPLPFLVEGGDCGACVLAGLLGIDSLEEVYDRFGPESTWQKKGTRVPYSWFSMRTALHMAWSERRLDRVIDEVPHWGVRGDPNALWGFPSWYQTQPWFHYIRMAIEAGHYAICAVCFDRDGPFGKTKGYGDHWVMIVGAREREEPFELPGGGKGAHIHPELLVSNSSTQARAEEWVEATEFLKHWGGYNAMLARPRKPPIDSV